MAEPPAISFTPKTGQGAGKPRQGIYRLEGKSLTVCLAYPGHARPTAFVAQPDVQRVRVYRRGGKAGARSGARPRAEMKVLICVPPRHRGATTPPRQTGSPE